MSEGQGNFRVIKTTTSDFGEKPKVSDEVFWQGDSTHELSVAYPPSQIYGADELGHSEIEDGYIRFDYRFEQYLNGAWQKIEDPRVRVTPISQYERDIDAENRRLFPGDYADELDDDYYDGYDDGPYDDYEDDPYDYPDDEDDPNQDVDSRQ